MPFFSPRPPLHTLVFCVTCLTPHRFCNTPVTMGVVWDSLCREFCLVGWPAVSKQFQQYLRTSNTDVKVHDGLICQEKSFYLNFPINSPDLGVSVSIVYAPFTITKEKPSVWRWRSKKTNKNSLLWQTLSPWRLFISSSQPAQPPQHICVLHRIIPHPLRI